MAPPRHPDLIIAESRLQTFLEFAWEATNPHAPPPMELVRAGFYCVKERDSVRCCYCSVGLNQWDPGDSPTREHARYSPRCPFLLRAMGRAYVLQTLMERELSSENAALVMEMTQGTFYYSTDVQNVQ